MKMATFKAFGALLALLPLAATAWEPPQTGEQLRDEWASVLYCQAVFEEPQVSGRIYPGDHQSCQHADALMRHTLEQRVRPQDRVALEQAARSKAQSIRYNTRDVQAAVMACRETCRELAAAWNEGPGSQP